MQRKCISAVLWQNAVKYLPNLHQMYSKVSIGLSHTDNSTGFAQAPSPHPPLKQGFPTFHYITSSLSCLPIFFSFKNFKPPPQDAQYFNRTWQASSHIIFLLQKNSLFRAPFFPHTGIISQRHMQFQ